MAISMQVGAMPPGLSNYERPVSAGPASYQFYETIYTNIGPNEWIIMTSIGYGGICASVTVSFPNGTGTCFLEGTTSPAHVVDGTQVPKGCAGPVCYPVQGHPIDPNDGSILEITQITNFTIQGPTAIRINLTGGTAMISVRV
jgi:hypothetical protein